MGISVWVHKRSIWFIDPSSWGRSLRSTCLGSDREIAYVLRERSGEWEVPRAMGSTSNPPHSRPTSRNSPLVEAEPLPIHTAPTACGGSSMPKNPRQELFAKELRSQIEAWRDTLRRVCSLHQVPWRRDSERYRYYTFAGRTVNRAIALQTRMPEAEYDDISLLLSSPMNWVALPGEPGAFGPAIPQLFEASARQSLFQQQLPIDFQAREYLEGWLKDPVVPQILARLSKSEPVNIDGVRWP